MKQTLRLRRDCLPRSRSIGREAPSFLPGVLVITPPFSVTSKVTETFEAHPKLATPARNHHVAIFRYHRVASATSQLDRNTWQRVATYKSGSKQTWRRIFFVWNHIEKGHGSNTSPASTLLSSYSQVFLGFFLQVQIPCYFLSSCAMSFVEPYRRSVVPVQHCCLEEDPSRPSISFPWAVLCVVDFLSLILVGHSTGKTDETMKRRQVHHTSTSNDFHAAWFVDESPRPSIDVVHDRKQLAPYSTQILPNPHLFNYESVSCRKVARTF